MKPWSSSTQTGSASNMNGNAFMAESNTPQAQTPRRNSRFIPEAERGWYTPEQRPTSSMMRRSSSGQSSPSGWFENRRRSSITAFKAKWASPTWEKKQLPKGEEVLTGQEDTMVAPPQIEMTEEAEEEALSSGNEEEDDDDPRLHARHPRERSSSVPDLPQMQIARSRTPSRKDRNEREIEQPQPAKESLGAKRGQPMKINLESLQTAVNKKHVNPEEPPTPLQLTNQNSFTPSLELQRTRSIHHPSRGYAWKPESHKEHKGYVPPSHRNPTSMQAFYDSHFGSSSGFRSVAGLADDMFHPIGSAKHMLSKLGNTKKHNAEKKIKQQQQDAINGGVIDESALQESSSSSSKDSFLSWRGLPFSPAIFGMGSSSSMQANEQQASQKRTVHPGEYEPELIPTVHRDPHTHRYFKKLEGNVVILGGYRGSILRDATTHQMIWVPLKVGVGLRRPTLELGLTEAAEDNSEELVIADEMLSGIGNMVDTGKRLLVRCAHKKRTKVHSWGFDWRLTLSKSSEKFEKFLQELYDASSDQVENRKGAKVVAHSMGGLVAMHALARTKNPKIFESLVFASTPFLGTANILGPFAYGDAALWNDEICSPRATFSFRSSFYLLPTHPTNEKEKIDTAAGRCFEEEDGKPHDVDFLDPETWNDLGFSPCVQRGGRKAAADYLRKNATKKSISIDGQIEDTNTQRETSLLTKKSSRNDPEKDSTDKVPAMPLANVQMDGEDISSSKPAKAVNVAIQKGQKLAGDEDDTEHTLHPANRQESNDQQAKEEGIDEEAEEAMSWAYLEKTLAETKQFFYELRTSFKQESFEKGLYPPISILTSGRTPTVRGALVWPKGSEALEKQEAKAKAKAVEEGKPEPELPITTDEDHWKRTARLRDYSRMLYAPGDGVILRESSISLPGQWGKLLVKDDASLDERGKHPLTNEEGVVETSHRHVTLLSDVDGIGRCLEACRRARMNGWPKVAVTKS
ncbi:uncharacterized protein FA14DRAFT_173723 [Meira miltonrushii]|uniref:Alpha/beta-hydrolase n=1 Tax=Meira miltonrushii TaxID=1280837 RepID=A0A316V935_9BASI|nr:uncharacterized protein FA14DRAFT_173723 [Meira miltonrushii]PWN34000.1 hypothetical protein FA14DRAFT_173723 [Meira miltonrushii]